MSSSSDDQQEIKSVHSNLEDKEKYTNDDDDQEKEDSDDSQQEESEDKDLGEVDRYWPPPTTESLKLTCSKTAKTISAFSFNNGGTRFATGGHNYELQIWNFETLNEQYPEPICNVQPCGQCVIKNLEFSNNDELILVISGSCQAVIIAKDGLVSKQNQCSKGDQYITDMSKTKGHVQMLNDGCWNPKEPNTFLTCSNDATLRIWDLNKLSEQKTVIKTRSPISGLKATPNVCRYSRDTLSIVAGCNDGSVMMWDTRRKFITTSACIKNAHLKGSEITGIDFSYSESNKICTRSEDESCKIWDIRNVKQPISTCNGLNTSYSTTNCAYSPDDRFIITGTSCRKESPGELLFLDAQDLSKKTSIKASDNNTSIIKSKWHPKINHIGYSCSNGTANVAYDKERSLGGCSSSGFGANNKGKKRKKYVSQAESTITSIKKIITPHALPLFREDQASSFAKIRQDPKRSYKPEIPISGASQGGRVKPAGSTLSSYIARNIAKPVDSNGLDIRERILRHAEEAEKEPFWFKRPVQTNTGEQQQQPKQQPKTKPCGDGSSSSSSSIQKPEK